MIDQALAGLRVVSLATNIPGPLAAARLHELGATVVKIEPLRGDALEHAAPSWYAELCAGQDVQRADLRSESGQALLKRELARADVLVSAMRANALERLGLGWSELHRAYPRLSHVAVFGEAPPFDSRAGHDLTYQARAGLIRPPALPRTVISDLAAAERAVSAALAALFLRERTGRGVRADIAIVDAADTFAAPLRHGLTAERGPLGGGLAFYNVYETSDGWIAVAALEPHFVAALCELLATESPDVPTLRAIFRTRSAREWELLANERDVPLAAVRTHEVLA
ncbi:MAG: CoA transferase [Vulcanimicrobiaceae bacterium]